MSEEKKDVSLDEVNSYVDKVLLDFAAAIRNVTQLCSRSILERDNRIKELNSKIKELEKNK